MGSTPKKIGSIVLATDQGLGYLAKSFYDNGIINKVYVKPHSSRTNHYDWYPDRVSSPDDLLDCDALLFFEEVFDWKIIPKAREKGIKTVLMVMYECSKCPFPYEPDLILTPSDLDQKYYPQGVRVNVPVEVPWKLRKEAKVFVHNAGNGGLGGRNGTRELLEAMKYVTAPIKLIVRSQIPITEYTDPRIEYRIGTFDDIWSEGDVFVFPEKFNGLSLPLQEAFASGMLVMTTDRFPNNTWLPKEPLIPVEGYKKDRFAVEFDSAQISPLSISQTIESWYRRDVTQYSLQGKAWAKANSWKKLKQLYLKICEKR